MYKLIGAILGLLITKYFILSEVDDLRLRLFLDVLSGDTNFMGNSPLSVINFNTLTSSTSIKLILGPVVGFFVGDMVRNKMQTSKPTDNTEEKN